MNQSIHLLDDMKLLRSGVAVLRRLEWIENQAFWTGEMRRKELCDKFQISPQQASTDIAAYLGIRKGNLEYNTRNKSYRPSEKFDPIFPKDPQTWLSEEQSTGVSFERVSSPWKASPVGVLKAVMASSRTKIPLSILYSSVGRDTPVRRTICPHTVVDADGRLHARAFDYERRRFSDFVLTRVSDPVSNAAVSWVVGDADTEWHEMIDIRVAPAGDLSESQSASAMTDLGLPIHGGSLRVRKAHAFYLLSELGLLRRSSARHVCSNVEEIMTLLPGLSMF